MSDFATLPDGPVRLDNLRLAAGNGLEPVSLTIADGLLTDAPADIVLDMAGRIAMATFVDMHTHLDKGHIWPRSPNPDGTFMGALATVRADHARWSAEDVEARMRFSLRCAWAHGTRAIRTHLDSMGGQYLRSWPVFDRLRAEWAGRIDLQAVSLVSCESFGSAEFDAIADTVAAHNGVLGFVTYPLPDLRDRLLGFWEAAGTRGLAADFHCDETMDPGSETLRLIAQTKLEAGFAAPVTVGHCCSLSTQDDARALETLDLVAEARISVVSLPMCNLYLQDRHAGRTPRGRGVTLVHEMAARGIPVSFASDNTRDPFYAYGDMDMLEVMREATRIAHLDHSGDWVPAFSSRPAASCGFAPLTLAPGAPADLVMFNARSWTELFARPQSDRIVIRDGRQIDRTLPAYAELDGLMEGL
ncbi:MAG: cytosine deaminase [Pseudomonadota bacterium]